MTFLPRPGKAARTRLALAIGLGIISILGGLLLAVADLIRGSVTWAHHSPVSAGPLFLIAAAIAAVSFGRPPGGSHGLLRLVAILAFTAWGTAQVVPGPAAASALNDAAVLLFVIDGGCAVIAEARGILARHEQTGQAAWLQRDPSHLQPACPRVSRAASRGPARLRAVGATVHLRVRVRASVRGGLTEILAASLVARLRDIRAGCCHHGQAHANAKHHWASFPHAPPAGHHNDPQSWRRSAAARARGSR